jgi:hypothetical protein
MRRRDAADLERSALRFSLGTYGPLRPICECVEIIPAAVDALEGRATRSSAASLSARICSRSAASTRFRDDRLAQAARPCGAVAASAFGGGFGGSVPGARGCSDAPFLPDGGGITSAGSRNGSSAAFFETRPGPPACGSIPMSDLYQI